MDEHIKDYFEPLKRGKSGSKGRFVEVIALHEKLDESWDKVQEKMESFPRGWYELAHLSREDRIGFTQDFWLSKMPFHPQLAASLNRFFQSLDDVAIYLTQEKSTDPYQATLVYSLKNNGGFFRGGPPIKEEELMGLEMHFPAQIFPPDYVAFLKIHNRFCKATDTTGILSSDEVMQVFKKFQEIAVAAAEPLKTKGGKVIDPRSVIPFYESFGMPYFQCFFDEWHTEMGMGNVYYAVNEKLISDPEMGEGGAESLTFPSFTEWLVFYMEGIE